MEIKANIEINEDDFSSLSEEIKDVIFDDLADQIADKITDSIIESIDVEERIDGWMSDNFCIDDHMRNIDLSDHIDLESEARSLLQNYSPSNGCGTGNSFTEAVERAVRYLCLKDDDFADDLMRALDRARRNREIADTVKEHKDFWIEDAKPRIIQDFKNDLEQFFREVEMQKAKEILGVNENQATVVPMNSFNTNIA